MLKYYVVFILFMPVTLWAQEAIPLGTWRTHFSFHQTHTLVVAQQKIYAAATNGLFYYDQEDQSVNVFSKIDGLHDVGIATMAFHADQEALLIAYRSGSIDVVTQKQIFAVDLLKNASGAQTEQVHQIVFSNDSVFMATSVGVRVFKLDVEAEEPLAILESYTRLGENGINNLPVYGSVISRDSIFIGTSDGVLAASLSPLENRQDYSNWRRFDENEGIPLLPVSHILAFEGNLYAALPTTLYRYQNGQWESTSFTIADEFEALSASDGKMLIIADDQIFTYNQEEVTEINSQLAQNPAFAQYDDQGVLWVADKANGLVKINGSAEENFFPSGPVTDDTWAVNFAGNQIIGMAGGYGNNYVPAGNNTGFYSFEKGIWQSHTDQTREVAIADLVDVAYNPIDKQFYFASFGDGIGVWDGGETMTLIDENSPGSTLVNTSPPDRFTRISALDIDSEGRLWIANYGANTPLQLWNPQNNNWRTYSFSQTTANFPMDVLVAVSGDKWVRLEGGDILVFNHETGEDRYLSNAVGGGGLPGSEVTTMASDKDGMIWVGTDQGVAFFPDPYAVFSEEIDAIRPIFDRRALLRDQVITSIAVDGGNRKWIGTPNGLWLFGEAGETLIHNFTTDNSPLPSNNIKDIAIDAISGEVFIATDKGMVSYRGTATEGSAQHQSVKIFPNPVSMSFNGLVGISGLVDNAIVKITTITGALVKEVRAEGGTVSWNATDYRGERVATGVYLVFSASADGGETFVGKIAVIN